ncbi:hypothetical protein GCM10011289_01950 [Paludibacterium paludis]|uniref:Uncharacterized protein n=1 Tax=Paludibacterium paludis TaxID=1225769 RepID=A0A918NXY0_9NEIS|nr:hypothetical protein GCM10011289_01950 [Paludibacterium paludis]
MLSALIFVSSLAIDWHCAQGHPLPWAIGTGAGGGAYALQELLSDWICMIRETV